MEIYKIFFATFSLELYDWIARLANSQGRYKLDQLIVWTPELVRRLEALEDKIMRVVGHWLDQTIGGCITEFVIDTTMNYSEAERRFLKGSQGRYVKSLNTYIKMLLCEKRVM